MSEVARIFAAAGALMLSTLVIYLVARKLLSPGQSVLWMVIALSALAVAVHPPLFFSLSSALGAESAVSTLSFLGLVYFAAYSLYLTARVTRLEERLERMAIETAVLGDASGPEDVEIDTVS